MYYPGVNWCFGGFTATRNGLGYVLMSSARINDSDLAKDLLRHELGHMFGAPSQRRTNTSEMLGNHCLNDLCVMQQRLSIEEAVKYAKQRKRANAEVYCCQCENDITEYEPNS